MTDDKILFYAAETTLQLYMAESNENIRELYAVAYSLPDTSSLIMHAITEKLEHIFAEHLPNLETKDFFEFEIASGGVMRSFMTVPCNMYFTMERKVRRFLETTFRIYQVPEEKIEEAIKFVSQFDYPTIAQSTIKQCFLFGFSSFVLKSGMCTDAGSRQRRHDTTFCGFALRNRRCSAVKDKLVKSRPAGLC